MFNRKDLRRMLSASLMIGSLLFMPIANAAVETYTGVGEYTMGEYENLSVAQERAKAKAERDAQEQAGIFVSTYSRVENHKLTADEISTMTAGIIKVLEVKPQIIPIDNKSIKYVVTVVVNIDSDEINRWLEQNAQQMSELVEQNRELQRKSDEQQREIIELKKRLVGATTKSEKQTIEQKIKRADDEFLAVEKLRAGNSLTDHSEAIRLYSEAIELDPKLAMAYNNRGFEYIELKEYELALGDLNRAVELDSKLTLAYNNRGRVFARLKQYDRAIADYNKAIELNPNYANAYNNLGYTYDDLNRYDRAIENYSKAIELNPNFAMAYNNRGFTYCFGMRDYARAIADFDKAIEINPNFDWAHNNRGSAYYEMKDYARAIADYSKAIELNPRYAKAYRNRGNAYQALGDAERAQADFDKAKSLGG